VANSPAKVPSVISYSVPIGSVSPCTVTISVAAFTMLGGSYSVSYGALSAGISLVRGNAYTIYLYFDDPAQAGGSPTLVVTQNVSDIYASDGRVYLGAIIVSVPATGSGSGSGGGGGGCVAADQYMLGGGYAQDVHAFDVIVGNDGDDVLRPYMVAAARISWQPCLRLVTESGARVVASISTPMTLPDRSLLMFPQMLGQPVLVFRKRWWQRKYRTRWERVVLLEPVGVRPVNQISIGGNCYPAGERRGIYINTHNTYVSPK
jgi:hypothetical protein